MPLMDAAAREKPPKQLIPNVIYQTYKTRDVHEQLCEVAEAYIELNPGYDYVFFDDQQIVRFLKEHFGDVMVGRFNEITIGAGKADLFRLCLLYINGGIYTDLDNYPVKGFQEFIKPNSELVVGKNLLGRWDTACLMSIPGHRGIRATLDRICWNVDRGKQGTCLSVLGPPNFRIACRRLRPSIDIHTFDLFQPHGPVGRLRKIEKHEEGYVRWNGLDYY